MQLDALTAGIALIVVQFCTVLIMAGIFSATPRETCTRYWIVSGIVLALGLALLVTHAGGESYIILWLGNVAVILGLLLQWCGIRAFYHQPQSAVGWIAFIAFFLCSVLFLLAGAPARDRAILNSLLIVLIFMLDFVEVARGQRKRFSFGGILMMGAFALIIASFLFRIGGFIFHFANIMPNTNTLLSVSVLYLVPIAGTLLLESGTVLLYFERMVADKHHLATHDELTGALNRRAIVIGGEREVKIAVRRHQPLALAYVDVDHFKEINDRYGHKTGDHVLIDIASLLRQTCRDIDLVGRYGGDEFCIVFPGVDRHSVAQLGERLVTAVRNHRFAHGLPVSISIGLASISGNDPEDSWAGLIQHADRALYQAKAAGRDQMAMAA